MELDSHKLLAGAGTPADANTFNEYIQKNLKLYELNNDIKLNTRSAANFIRKEVKNVKIFSFVAPTYMLKFICFIASNRGTKGTISNQHITRRI